MDLSFLIHAPCEYVKSKKSIDPGSNHVLVTDAVDISLWLSSKPKGPDHFMG